MLRRARLRDCMSSVRLSVTFRYRDHTRFNTSKVISRPNSLRLALAYPNIGDQVQREHPKIRVESGLNQEHIKAAKSPKRCKIGPTRLLLRTIRKSHTRFRLAPTLMTLDDLERPKRRSCRNEIVLRSPP